MNTQQECIGRDIPAPTQREVRQRCGFGCVVCGFPLYQYHHMEEWSVTKTHEIDGITLLCDQHHRELHARLLPAGKILDDNINPFNLRLGVSKPYDFHFSGAEAAIEIGSNSFTLTCGEGEAGLYPIIIDYHPLIWFLIQDGHLLLNLQIFDKFNNKIMVITDNQLVYSTIPWDIELVKNRLTIREEKRKILLEIDFCPPSNIIVRRGRFLLNGVEIIVRHDCVFLLNNHMVIKRLKAINAPAGFILGYPRPQISACCRIPNVHRYGVDRKAALRVLRRSRTRLATA